MKLVLFDLDDTLIQGDSAKLWLKFCVEKGFLPQEYLEKIVFYQKQYQEKKLDMDEFMTFFLQSVKGKNEDRISSVGGKIKCRKRKIKCRIFATNYLSFNLKLKL